MRTSHRLVHRDDLDQLEANLMAELERLPERPSNDCPADLVDLATHRAEAEQVTVERARVARRLADVREARAQLQAGTYGTCEICGGPIDGQRLAVLPTTTRCRGHASVRVAPSPHLN